MSTSTIVLQDFICPIPICQHGASWDKILSAFQDSSCSIVAIADIQQKILGVISSERAISFLAQHWLNKATVSVGLKQNIHPEQFTSAIDYNSLLDPVSIINVNLEQKKLLTHLRRDFLINDTSTKYLVVDAQHQLLGLLDTQKLLNALLFKSSNQQLTSFPIDFLELELLNLLEHISSPLMLQTADGKTWYHNFCWRELIEKNKTDNNFKNDLLANITHELKSPLTGIVGLSSLLKEETIGTLNQRQLSYVELIHKSGRKLINIVSKLLELTNLSKGKLTLNLESVEIESLCQQVYEQVVKKLNDENESQKNLRYGNYQKNKLLSLKDLHQNYCGFQLQIELDVRVAIADKSRLFQVLFHLLRDALISSSSQGEIGISVSSCDSWIAFTVWSDSLNNSSSQMRSHFSSLLHSEKTLTGEESNIDLTAVLVQQLATVQGGKISVIPRLHKKNEITLLLPKSLTSNPALPRKMPQQTNSEQKNSKTVNGKRNLTILCLYPEPEALKQVSHNNTSNLDFNLKNWAEQDWNHKNVNGDAQNNYYHRIIEANGLEQAEMLSRIWQLDVIVINGEQIEEPNKYLRSLKASSDLAALPLVTLEPKTTAAANQIEGLNVYPCLVPAECRTALDLMEVIQIAAGII